MKTIPGLSNVGRILRLFAYGFQSVILVLNLNQIGLKILRIGLLLPLTLFGDTVISLWIRSNADDIPQMDLPTDIEKIIYNIYEISW